MVLLFKLYKEMPPNADGSIQLPSYYGDTAEVFIEDIDVTTNLESTIVPIGNVPEIIPLGPKDRTCKIVGTFKDNMINATEHVGSEVTDETKLSVLQEDSLRGILIKSNNSTELPELGNAYWRIDEFTWNRDAKKMGKYEFSMTLGYIWMNPAESKIYNENCANKKSQNVQFEAIIDGTPYSVYNLKVYCSVFKPNVATFQLRDFSASQYDSVEIYSSSNKTNKFFTGYVKHLITTTSGELKYECWENGCAIYEVKCCNPKPGLFKPAQMIRSKVGNKTLKIKEVADTILKNNYTSHSYITTFTPDQVIFKDNNIAQMDKLPGRNIPIPTQIISGMSVGNALESFLVNQCNLYLWFGKNTIETGFIRDEIVLNDSNKSKYFIESSEKLATNDETIKPDYVIVFDTKGNPGVYPTTGLKGNAISVAYKLNTDLTDSALQAYAQKVYEDLTIVDKSQYRVVFPAGVTDFKEADYFRQIGDETTTPQMSTRYYNDPNPLEDPGDSVWQIKEVTITDTSTEVIIGPSYRSIFDIYGAQLQLCAEAPTPVEVMKWKSASVVAGEPQ